MSLCTGLFIYNVVAYREFQKDIEERIKMSLQSDIAEQMDEISEQLEKRLVVRLEKKLLKHLEPKLERKMEAMITREVKLAFGKFPSEKSAVSALGSDEVKAEDHFLSVVADEVQGRVEKLWTAHLEKRLSALTEEKVQAEILKWHDLNSGQIVNETRATTMDKMAANRREKRNTSQLTYVHLHGRRNVNGRQAIIYDTDHNFVWDRLQTPHGNGFRYVPDPNTGAISKIQIKTRGVYMIYSQIAVRGTTENGTIPVDCAQQTMQTLASDESDVILLSSRVTQYNLGASFATMGGEPYYPLDTKLQMGIFVLSANDRLRVRFNEGCGHFNYLMSRDYTYFGVLRLG
ncbi:hypothetical protein Btru_039212 [Bulinus truncatus]|nr:hypothetical protein Btru_039212 [Bulinus truncatus]